MTDPALSCRHLTFRYLQQSKKAVLEDVSLTVPQGEITVLMGSSGCGKSTLAAVLCGLLPENGGILECGEIQLFGRPLASLSPPVRCGDIAMMFQNPDLQFCMETLEEELYFCLENISCPPGEMPARAEQAARLVGASHLLQQPLHTLSGGEKQRCMLACICLLDARCILLDEPFANLDPDCTRELVALLGRLNREQGKTILAIDHMSDHWLGTAHRFVLLGQGGKVLCQAATPQELEQARPLFLEQGVAYPGIWRETTLPPPPLPDSRPGIVLKNLSIPATPPKKKKKLPPLRAEDCLLHNVSVAFPAGAITAILGPSGCGKTSLLMTLLGQRPYEGSILLEGAEVRTLSPSRLTALAGCAFQNPSNQFITQNVAQEVSMGTDRTPDSPETRDLLESVGLGQYRRYSPYMLSQGQQRRLAVLAVLSGGQPILLLDEPTYGQDFRSVQALMELVRDCVRERGLTVLMTTHDAQLAHACASLIYTVENRSLRRQEVEA